jgi:hypothetical protein
MGSPYRDNMNRKLRDIVTINYVEFRRIVYDYLVNNEGIRDYASDENIISVRVTAPGSIDNILVSDDLATTFEIILEAEE